MTGAAQRMMAVRAALQMVSGHPVWGEDPVGLATSVGKLCIGLPQETNTKLPSVKLNMA